MPKAYATVYCFRLGLPVSHNSKTIARVDAAKAKELGSTPRGEAYIIDLEDDLV
jgi:hypothetical protein